MQDICSWSPSSLGLSTNSAFLFFHFWSTDMFRKTPPTGTKSHTNICTVQSLSVERKSVKGKKKKTETERTKDRMLYFMYGKKYKKSFHLYMLESVEKIHTIIPELQLPRVCYILILMIQLFHQQNQTQQSLYVTNYLYLQHLTFDQEFSQEYSHHQVLYLW